jgi:hypothetical protein
MFFHVYLLRNKRHEKLNAHINVRGISADWKKQLHQPSKENFILKAGK